MPPDFEYNIDVDTCPNSLPWLQTDKAEKYKSIKKEAIVDSIKIIKFLKKSCSVIEALLEENAIASGIEDIQESHASFSTGSIVLTLPIFLSDRRITKLAYSPFDPRLLSATLSRSTRTQSSWSNKGIICLWRLNTPNIPYRILQCESEPICTTFSQTNSSIIACGTIDGGIQVWNLSDTNLSSNITLANITFCIQQVSYSTHGLSGPKSGAIKSLFFSYENITSVDEFGFVKAMIVQPIVRQNDVNFDYGQSFGSSIRLVDDFQYLIPNPRMYTFY